ncbi:CHAT domain-containing protein [Rhizobium laguerreae]|uniref:CHAT domain-containing protein n=1 Tax=Rhizobium laguerreae TaxID=1076926 RepID=A0A7Y2R707_9HYPH|nr:CHAT domain-containing protein [Rhizobium laguerreae]NNH41876.1 hypothetical protein [Rhizobium laguerreae]NNH57085.1 hypothetical protein [Rhizobium laguerreae]NNH65520.1 hypothetical protein [Rhizobium laguerreae]
MDADQDEIDFETKRRWAAVTEITYVVVLEDGGLESASPFQGISNRFDELGWTLRQILDLPPDLLSPALPPQGKIGMRVTGRGWNWMPLMVSELEKINISETAPFWVAISGHAAVAKRTKRWCSRQSFPVFHITDGYLGDARPGEANRERIRRHLRKVMQRLPRSFPPVLRANLGEMIEGWRADENFPLSFTPRSHNCTLPNLVTLQAVGADMSAEIALNPLVGNEGEFVDAIEESTLEVLALRATVAGIPALRVQPQTPDVIVAAPAAYSHFRVRMRRSVDLPAGFREAIQLQQRQTGYRMMIEGFSFPRELIFSPGWQTVMGIRGRELQLQTHAIALRAASTFAATIRLPSGVNTFPDLRNFTNHIRGKNGPNKLKKTIGLFQKVQSALTAHCNSELLEKIALSRSGVKLVSDAPLEWLPCGGLPLCIARDVSRIPATPGNLMMIELVPPRRMFLDPSAFEEILVISSFQDDDHLKDILSKAVKEVAQTIPGHLRIKHVRVKNERDLVDAFNAFGGAMVILDCHGNHNERTGVGTLRIGSDDVDVWALRNALRSPPIVILSACDTHAPDRTHATVANGFLSCGARAVLGTFLPIRGDRAGVFAARLAYRASWYVSTLVDKIKTPVLWSEVVGSMVRLDFLSELISRIQRRRAFTQEVLDELRFDVDMLIHSRDPNWWSGATKKIMQVMNLTDAEFDDFVSSALGAGDSVRYTHLGNPETICITSEKILGSGV